MAYDPEIHHRRTIRLCDYDYAAEGFYFVTICVHEHRALFGSITDGAMHINDAGRVGGADRCVRPDEHGGVQPGEHIGSPLHKVVQWFKTMTTNAYIRGVKQNGWPPFHTRLWQRNYYEHIIRDQHSHDEIAEYILENPLHWLDDEYNTALSH